MTTAETDAPEPAETIERVMRFLFRNPLGILLMLASASVCAYFIAPVMFHGIVFEFLLRNIHYELLAFFATSYATRATKRYASKRSGFRGLTIAIGFLIGSVAIASAFAAVIHGILNRKIYAESNFVETNTVPRVSITHVRYTPHQVASEEIVRRTQTSEYTPGNTRAIGGNDGVAYVAPLIPQGFWNMFLIKNQGFMYFDDAGSDDEIQRVSSIDTAPFAYGEGMEVTDDIHRRLVRDIGFFKSYPEIYYTPVFKEGKITEVIGVVPYVSYNLYWGLWIPHWGGVAIFHADGRLEDMAPEMAMTDARLVRSQRLFPEMLAKVYVESQRCDQGIISCWIRRQGKIEVPKLPGDVQMPFFLPMEDGSYQYITTVEPDGEAYSLMRLYLVDARTGARSVYRFDAEGRNHNLQGPAKVLSYVKRISGYNWYEETSSGKSGSYRIVEPRLVTRDGRIYWMMSITPVDFARVVATVFVDAESNDVSGPFPNRQTTMAWLHGEEAATPAGIVPMDSKHEACERLRKACENINDLCPSSITTTP